MRTCVLLGSLLAVLSETPPAAAGDADRSLRKRLFLEGYLEGTLQPPRNEIDANLRRPDLLETDGFGYAFARYSFRGQIMAGIRLETRFVEDVFVIVKPDFLFGKTIPQRQYTWSPALIGFVRNYGVGLTLPGDVKVYFETHRWQFVGENKLGVPGGGPKGLHNSIVVRKEFRFGPDRRAMAGVANIP